MIEESPSRAIICFVCRTIVLAPALFFSAPGRVLAASGISDLLATRACWLQPPYALSKCYTRSGGPYHADLFLGRPSQFGDDIWNYEGIIHVETVASNLSRVALTRRYIIVEYAGSEPSFGVIDFQAGSVEPVQLKSEAELRWYLQEQGEGGERIRFETFEEVYGERRPWWRPFAVGLVCLPFLLFILVLAMVWIFRRRLGFVLRGEAV